MFGSAAGGTGVLNGRRLVVHRSLRGRLRLDVLTLATWKDQREELGSHFTGAFVKVPTSTLSMINLTAEQS